MKSQKYMLLGFTIVIVGACFLLSLVTAVPSGTATTISPLVNLFAPQQFTGAIADYTYAIAPVIQAEETIAFIIILVGLSVSVYGVARKD